MVRQKVGETKLKAIVPARPPVPTRQGDAADDSPFEQVFFSTVYNAHLQPRRNVDAPSTATLRQFTQSWTLAAKNEIHILGRLAEAVLVADEPAGHEGCGGCKEIDADVDLPAILHGLAAPNALLIFPKFRDVRVAGRFETAFYLSFGEAVSARL